MQGRSVAIAGLGLAAILLFTSCDTAETGTTALSTLPEFADIAALTEKSCLCRMAGRDATAVQQKLEQLTAPLQKEGFGSASLPLSSDVHCYPQLGEQACAGEYYVVATGTTDLVCTSAQADKLMQVWNATGRDADRRSTRADAALLATLSAMRQELAKSIPQSACN